jgi:hypothetical protein
MVPAPLHLGLRYRLELDTGRFWKLGQGVSMDTGIQTLFSDEVSMCLDTYDSERSTWYLRSPFRTPLTSAGQASAPV